MLNWLFNFFKTPPVPEPVREPVAQSLPERRGYDNDATYDPGISVVDYLNVAISKLPTIASPYKGQVTEGSAMDGAIDGSGDTPDFKRRLGFGQQAISDALALWFASQSFIGHQLAAMIAQHWLVDKACAMPAKDAIRKGFTITSGDGDELPPEVSKHMVRADRKYSLRKNMLEFIHMGRVFGIRIAIFKVRGTDYSLPFNIDSVAPGTYEGIVQIDPYWCSPQLDNEASAQPDSMHFYEPTYWNINGVRYHRTHLIIYRNGNLADILKPSYLFGGIPVPQQIMERVYGAERTANEAPLLAMTKRTTVYKTDLEKAMSNFPAFAKKVSDWARFWSNNGVRVIGTEEAVEQVDTALADLDTIIMTQYQLVAAAACVPATKLMGTSPKGFNASGEYEESSYHETLESMQEHDLSPFVNRHHLLTLRSYVTPIVPEARNLHTQVVWEPLDSMTAKEKADVELVQAQAGSALVASGAIDGIDERNRLISDKDSPYVNLPPVERPASITPEA